MSDLRLSMPALEDVEELLAFELDNRAFFESHVNARPDNYYSFGGVQAAIEESIRLAVEDKAYQHLLRDGSGTLVGRANLTRVRRTHFHSAELGYRIAQSSCGKGYASQAVGQILVLAFNGLKLVRVEATARLGNERSARVLANNGFAQFGRSTKSFQLAGVWHDVLHYERRADA